MAEFEAKKTYLDGVWFQVKETYLAENKSLPSYIIDLEEGKILSDVRLVMTTFELVKKDNEIRIIWLKFLKRYKSRLMKLLYGKYQEVLYDSEKTICSQRMKG